jgi:hypothetical protein
MMNQSDKFRHKINAVCGVQVGYCGVAGSPEK